MVKRDALEGQRALVTGASSGIGSAVARQLRSKEDDIRRFHADASAAGYRGETGPIVDCEKADWD